MVNAMAVPGGKMVVFSGLLESVSSTNGLMFILAHELGHFKNRDHLRLMGRGIVLSILAMLAFGGDSGFSDILASTINLRTAKYSQSRESQADHTALQALQCHFGHVGGATELFESLKAHEEGIDVGFAHYFSSHPELQERIDDLHRLSQELEFPEMKTEELTL
jgi:Zn-dependent protease with chaperone function